MYPVLFKIPLFGGITIYSYGVMVALAFIAGMIWVSRESRRLGQDPAKAVDLVFYVILSAIVGSRILEIIVSEWDRFLENPLMIFKIWEGGLVFYGGLIAAILVSIWYIRRHLMPLRPRPLDRADRLLPRRLLLRAPGRRPHVVRRDVPRGRPFLRAGRRGALSHAAHGVGRGVRELRCPPHPLAAEAL